MTTTLPAPTADAMDDAGRWPHMPALRSEVGTLLADLDIRRTTRGPDAAATAQAWHDAGWRRLVVAVYAPLGRDEVMPGWLSPENLRTAVDRLLAWLPGSRYIDPERGPVTRGGPASPYIAWGSRDPGWTPTAVRVERTLSGEWRERDQLWTATDVADHCGITRSAWDAYVSRRDAGAPLALGTIVEADARGHRRPTRVWGSDVVTAWHTARPGKGGRPRKTT